MTCGVPQGSILGPLMFVVFINDLDIALKETKLILYADYTVVYYTGKTSKEIIKILNDDLQELGKWFKKNNLVINMKKVKIEFVLYAKRIAIQQSSGEQINVTICGENVNQSASYDYLSVTLDSKLIFNEYCRTFIRRALQVLLRNNLTENAFGTCPERVRNASLNAFHLRSIRVQISFHLPSTFTGTHLRNAFRLHSYRNRTSSEIIAISRVLVSLTFTFCVHTIKHETAFLYLLSTNESRIKITYDVHITYMYVRGQYSGTKQNTI